MATDRLKGIRIGGIACCVPPDVVKTDDFKASLGERQVFIKGNAVKESLLLQQAICAVGLQKGF